MTRRRSLTRTALSPLAVLALSLALQVAGSGCASDTNGAYPAGGRGGQMQRPQGPSVYEIITALELEPEQLPAVRAVLEDAEDARQEIFTGMQPGSGGRPDPSAMDAVRAKMTDLNEQTEEQLAGLLTSEQMDEYREMIRKAEQERQEMRSQMGGRRGGPGGGRPGGR